MIGDNLNINSPDEELIDSFIKGNKNAFNLLARKYQKKVYWVVRKMVISHEDADDITQEVFIKLYKSLDQFKGESKFFTYVYKIAVNFSINHLNRNKIINSRHVNADTTELRSFDKSAEDEMIAKENSRILEEALETLPEQQRAVFNLRYYEKLSYEEIALILNKSVGGMKSNYFHAIKKIEKFLKAKRNEELMEDKIS